MKFDVIRMAFSSPLHISSGGNYYDRGEGMLRSDTLYSSVIQQLAAFDPEFAKKPEGFTFSSAFPFVTEDGKNFQYFLPKPPTDNFRKYEKEAENPKAIKKIKWVDSDFFQETLAGTDVDKIPMNWVKDEFLSSSIKIDKGIVHKETQLRIGVPREAGDTDVYYLEKTFFRKGAGLYFLCFFESDIIKEKVLKALELLELSGIGTDRSVGMGQFYLSFDSLELKTPTQTDYWMNLSLFLPESVAQLEGLLDHNAKYELVKRGGWITDIGYTTYRKQLVYLFQEGGVFKSKKPMPIAGRYQDLSPDNLPTPLNHPVWRVGRSIFLPIKL